MPNNPSAPIQLHWQTVQQAIRDEERRHRFWYPSSLKQLKTLWTKYQNKHVHDKLTEEDNQQLDQQALYEVARILVTQNQWNINTAYAHYHPLIQAIGEKRLEACDTLHRHAYLIGQWGKSSLLTEANFNAIMNHRYPLSVGWALDWLDEANLLQGANAQTFYNHITTCEQPHAVAKMAYYISHLRSSFTPEAFRQLSQKPYQIAVAEALEALSQAKQLNEQQVQYILNHPHQALPYVAHQDHVSTAANNGMEAYQAIAYYSQMMTSVARQSARWHQLPKEIIATIVSIANSSRAIGAIGMTHDESQTIAYHEVCMTQMTPLINEMVNHCVQQWVASSPDASTLKRVLDPINQAQQQGLTVIWAMIQKPLTQIMQREIDCTIDPVMLKQKTLETFKGFDQDALQQAMQQAPGYQHFGSYSLWQSARWEAAHPPQHSVTQLNDDPSPHDQPTMSS